MPSAGPRTIRQASAETGEGKPDPGLYLVALPIGNIRDITLRALDILASVDIIACEDTRRTGKLLANYGIGATFVRYHEHNAEKMRPDLLARLSAGASIALVSDAGMPTISDPGFKLVRAAREANLYVHCLPGACAVPTALAISGLPTDRFLFAGFLPTKSAQRRRFLEPFRNLSATLILFERAGRLGDSLPDIVAALGNRAMVIARELTKTYEEVLAGTVEELATRLAAAPPLRGEVTLVLAPPEPQPADAAETDAALRDALAHASVRDAAETVARALDLPRRQVYRRALALSGRDPGSRDPTA